mgnify:FL=1
MRGNICRSDAVRIGGGKALTYRVYFRPIRIPFPCKLEHYLICSIFLCIFTNYFIDILSVWSIDL